MYKIVSRKEIYKFKYTNMQHIILSVGKEKLVKIVQTLLPIFLMI